MAKTLIIHCNLRLSEPAVWRKVEVPEDLNLGTFLEEVLHFYEVSVWSHPHLLKATSCRRKYPDRDSLEMYAPVELCRSLGYRMMRNEARFTVGDIFSRVGKCYIMEYDFGDGWQIELKLIGRGDNPDLKGAVILEGEGFGILDDCGGIYMQNDFVIIQKAYADGLSDEDIQKLIDEYGMPYAIRRFYESFAIEVDLLTMRKK